MPLNTNAMTVSGLTEVLAGMEDAGDMSVRIANYDGDHGMQVYSVRKHTITNENGEVIESYVGING